MNVGRMFPFHKKLLVPVGFTALLLVALVTPTVAADNEYKGWFAALDVALTQPNSLDQHYADNIDPSGPIFQSRRLAIDNDTDTTIRFNFGYSWGTQGSLQVSYWEFDNEDRESGFLAYYVYPQVVGSGSYFYYAQFLYDADFEARSTVTATTIDLDFVRPVEIGDTFTLKWLAGLRVAEYEEDLSFLGDDGGSIYFQEKHLESDAVGLRVGVAGVFEFTEHFALESGLEVSFLQADTEATGSMSDDTGVPILGFQASDDNTSGEIRDVWVEAVWSYDHLDWYLGYAVSSWDGLVTDPFSNVGQSPFLILPITGGRGREGISFNSAYGGVRWRFGGPGP